MALHLLNIFKRHWTFSDTYLGPTETIAMPFKYVKDAAGKPILPDGMLDLLAKDADKDIMDLL